MSKDDSRPEDYVLQVRDNTRRYLDELISENESLRSMVTSLERQKTQREIERDSLRHRIDEICREHEDLVAQYEEIERQNNDLANLYVASYRLHETLARNEVISVIQEIVINLIGSEELAIFEADEEGRPELVASFGLDLSTFEPVALAPGRIDQVNGIVEQVIRSGERYVAGEVRAGGGEAGGGRVTGAIAVFDLLGHKPGLVPLDFELFDLLATHAATALYCSRLRDGGGDSTDPA
jgi:hypothetical protein